MLGVVAVALESMAPSASSENRLFEIVAGTIGGWMLVVAVVAAVVFAVAKALDAFDEADDHYLDYLER